MERADFVVEPESWQGHSGEDGEPEYPMFLADTSPDGAFVAMQWPSSEPTGAIWEAQTRRISYRPRGGVAFRWMENGSQLLLVRTLFRADPKQTASQPSPFQSDYGHTLELLTWPERKRKSRVDVVLPTGWPTDVVASPDGKQIAVTWRDQGECGCVFFRADGGILLPHETLSEGLFVPRFNGHTRPAFSPRGDWLAFVVEDMDTWWHDADTDDDPELLPAPGGPRTCGFVVLCDCRQGGHRPSIPIVVETKAGWIPGDDPIYGLNEAQYLFVGNPYFSDDSTLVVPLGDGSLWVHSLMEK